MPVFSSFFDRMWDFILQYGRRLQPATWLAVREMWSLTARGYAGEPSLTIFKKQSSLAFAAAVHSRVFLEWLQTLQTPELNKYAGLNRRLVLKPLRVYMSLRWGINQKIKIITDTYKLIQLSGAPLQDALLRSAGVNIARIAITNDSDFDVQVLLGHDNTFRKEGELVASLWCAAFGGPVISLVFSFEYQNGSELAMYIGCIQGRKGVDNKPISKGMHGLWPKVFIVFAAQEIARALSVRYIYGVGNNIHSHKKKHIVYIPSHHELSFDYDSLWVALGGKPSPGGWYNVPLQLERRPYESMKSNKRSMYARRYAMLDNTSEQIRSALLTNGQHSVVFGQ